MTHWAFILRARLHLYGQARNGLRDWLLGMAPTDIMTDPQSDKKVWLKDLAEFWAPFAAKDVAYQRMFWDKKHVYDVDT